MIAQTPVTIWLEALPVGKERARTFRTQQGSIGTKTPGKTKRMEILIGLRARQEMAGRALLEGPLSLVLRCGYAVPDSWSAKKRAAALAGDILPTVKPDIDNVTKLWADALRRIVYADDAQLVHLVAEKRYMPAPVTVCTVQGMADITIDKWAEVQVALQRRPAARGAA